MRRATGIAGTVLTLYLLLFVRGLGWEWREIIVAPGHLPALAEGSPVPAVQRSQGAPAGGAAAPPARSQGAPAAPAPAAPAVAAGKAPLEPTDLAPPRATTNERGVTFDGAGVAVLGIDADTGGVYNVPPGWQVRIGGPTGQLFDVLPGGKLTPAARVKDWPATS